MQRFAPLEACQKAWRFGIRVLAFVAAYQLIPFTLAAEAEKEPYNDRYCTTCHGTDGKDRWSMTIMSFFSCHF